ncbi:hypothetical protein F6R98_16640 [Candidatus Methylospira mobilis]|uniref:Group II intron maturase-specific domain-containing protein n=2 Tax=Candidatus Methylospira mobilis TaxID=1808979 RepID=A0A5Q0BMU1_9GAMM|nr:hypothetical protein F6R98_16640 [Candidatus Methylospira mobilis]
MDAEYVVGRLNRKLTGWANYFCLGPVSPAYRAKYPCHTTAPPVVMQEAQGSWQWRKALPRPIPIRAVGTG